MKQCVGQSKLNEDKSTAVNDNLQELFLFVGGQFVRFCTYNIVRAVFRHKILVNVLVSIAHFFMYGNCGLLMFHPQFILYTIANDFNNMFQRILYTKNIYFIYSTVIFMVFLFDFGVTVSHRELVRTRTHFIHD